MKKAVKKPSVRKTSVKAVGKKKAVQPKAVTGRLLGKDEPAPVIIDNAKGRSKCFIVCDHASNRIPKKLGNLGLSSADLQKHIAWDPGTEDIGRYIGKKIDAAVVYATYSRLVVDVNRGHKNRECMRATSDHIEIPGNKALTAAQKKQRLDEIFWPYHAAIDGQVQSYVKRRIVPLMLSLHSFTPKMDGYKRPWHIGVLWNKESRIAHRLIENLRQFNPDIVVGENEPYSLKAARLNENTVSRHAEDKEYPYIIVEFRQDLVNTKAKAKKWADILIKAMAPILADPAVYTLLKQRSK